MNMLKNQPPSTFRTGVVAGQACAAAPVINRKMYSNRQRRFIAGFSVSAHRTFWVHVIYPFLGGLIACQLIFIHVQHKQQSRSTVTHVCVRA